MITALVSTSQSSSLHNFYFDTDAASQPDQSNDQSDGQQGDQAATVDGFLFQKRFALLTPPQNEKPASVVLALPEEPVLAKSSRAVPFLIPACLLISMGGLLPRAPSVV